MPQDTQSRIKRIEKELNAVLYTMADGVVIIDMEGKISYANPQAEKILGMRRNDIEEAYYFDNKWKQIDEEGNPLKPEELPVAVALKHKKSIKDYIHGITDGEGNTKWLAVSVSLMKNEGEDFFGALAYFRDITAQRNQEEELKQAAEFYLTLFDQLPTPKMRFDRRGQCNYINIAWTNLTGRNLQEEMDTGWVQGIHEEDRKKVREHHERAVKETISYEMEYRLLTKHNGVKWVIDATKPFTTRTGAHGGFIKSCHDITSRKEYEEKIFSQLQEELSILDRLQRGEQTPVTARSFGNSSLRARYPDIFPSLQKTYQDLLKENLENSAFSGGKGSVQSAVKTFSTTLSSLYAGPRDLIELHTLALRKLTGTGNTKKDQAITDEGRYLLLELMGNLVGHYRNFAFGNTIQGEKQE